MLQVEEINGSLSIPPFGAKLKLLYKNKHTEKEEVARISPGPEKNHYYAYFEDDDVDFQIDMDNSSCKDRSVRFGTEIMNKKDGFIVRPNETWTSTLESKGKKLHFIRQCGEKGKSLISSTASTCGISRQDASTLLSKIEFKVNYEVRNFTLVVKDEERQETNVQVNSKTTIDQLKDKLAEKIRHPVGSYLVSLNGKELDDYDAETTLGGWKIDKNYQLICEKIEFPVQVKIQKKGKKSFTFFVVSSSDLVQDLKKKIEAKEGISIAQQKLFYNKKELYYNMSALGWSGITRNSVLDFDVLEIFPLKIKIIPSNKIVYIPICSRNTFDDVMRKIEEQEGIPTQQQSLYVHACQISATRKLLEDDGVEKTESATIFVVVTGTDEKAAKIQKKNPHECQTGTCFPITVTKRNDGTIIKLNVCSSELIGEVKEKIYEKTGILVQDQKLRRRLSDGNILKLQDDFPLELYEIRENTQLLLISPVTGAKIMVVEGCLGETPSIEIPFFPSQTVMDLLSRVHEETGIRPHSQGIYFDGKKFCQENQTETLSEFNVQEGDVLEMYPQPFSMQGFHFLSRKGCSCQKPSCSDCALDSREGATITFGGKSSQTFSSCTFDADESIKIEPFILELRLAGVPLLS